MADVVGICNAALGWLGAKPITSLDDASKTAELCKANFALQRDTVMEAKNWSFAVKRRVLAASATPPEFGFSVAYPLPSLVLRVIEAFAQYPGDMEFAVEDRAVLCNQDGGINVRTVDRVEDPALWSPGFCTALAYRLAAALCIPLTENRTLMADYEALYKQALAEAAVSDGKQGTMEQRRAPRSLLVARNE